MLPFTLSTIRMMTDFVRVGGLNKAEAFERRLVQLFPSNSDLMISSVGYFISKWRSLAGATSAEMDRQNFEAIRANFEFIDEGWTRCFIFRVAIQASSSGVLTASETQSS